MSVVKPCQYLSKKDIEQKAYKILNDMKVASYDLMWPLDSMSVAEFLELDFDFKSISPDDKGTIAAMIFPQQKLIVINQDLSSMIDEEHSGFRESTIGHEIGHWVLHINRDEVDGKTKQGELDLGISTSGKNPFLCRSFQESEDWREWQAQYFSSCLIMPRYILEKIRPNYDLGNVADLYKMKDEVGVTISNLKHRLKDLGWISDTSAHNSHEQETLLY